MTDVGEFFNLNEENENIDDHNYYNKETEERYEYFQWTSSSSKLLIEYYKQYRKKVGGFEIRNMKKFWELISEILNKKHSFKCTPSNCENRWRVLERNYKTYVDNSKKTGRGRKYFEFVDEMNSIFGKKRNINPEILLSQTTVDHNISYNKNVVPTKPKIQEETSNIVGNVEEGNNIQKEVDMVKASSSKQASSNKENIALNETKNRKRLRSKTNEKIEIFEKARKNRDKYQEERLELKRVEVREKKRQNDLYEARNKLLLKYLEKSTELPNLDWLK